MTRATSEMNFSSCPARRSRWKPISMPDVIRTRLQPGAHPFTLVTSISPSFDFAHWTYSDLFSGSWTAYAFADKSFTVP